MNTLSSLEPLEARIAPASLVVTNLSDVGFGSLREAIADSHNGDVITFKTGLTGIIHVQSAMTIPDSITINGGGNITLDGGGTTRVFIVDDNESSVLENVTLTGLTIRNGHGTAAPFDDPSGGAIVSYEALTIGNSAFKGNTSTGDGGAIVVEPFGKLTVSNSTFSNNSAAVGGAIETIGAASVLIQGSYFSANYAALGGAVTSFGGTGGPSVSAGPDVSSIAITGSQFYKNVATGEGGGAYVQAGDATTITIASDTFSTNQSFASSTAPGAPAAIGGAFVLDTSATSTASITNTLAENNLTQYIGTVIVGGNGKVSMTNCTVKNNHAEYGGGIYYQGPVLGAPLGSLVLTNTSITGNVAAGGLGGGIYFQYGALTLNHTTITNNSAALGGGIFDQATNDGGHLDLIASIIKDNTPDEIYTD